jgi:hypothetical protein
VAAGDTTELLADIRERGSLPSEDLRYTDAKLLTAATKELRDSVAPLLHSTRAEHMVYSYESSVTAGTATVRIPPRALGGGGLREVRWQPASSNRSLSLVEVSADRAHEWEQASGTPSHYYLRNASVVLLPTPDAAGTLHMPYYARPLTLTTTNSASVNAAADVGTGDGGGVELSFSGDVSATYPVGAVVDVVRATPVFETLASAAVTVSTYIVDDDETRITLAVAADVEAGDWLCAGGVCPVVQAPLELHGLLAARTVRRVLKAAGDARWQDYEPDVAELTATALQWLSPRNSGASQSHSPANPGLLFGVIR